MLALLIACHRSPSNDDSAPVLADDSTPDFFDPETDLEWHVIDGTDGDCGTAWPLSRLNWQFESNWGENVASHDSWTIDPALSRSDVWDATLLMSFYWDEGFHSHSLGVGARWRFQCDRGAWLLLGVLSGSSSEWTKLEIMRTRSYAASFENPVRIALADSTFEVEGALWYSDGDHVHRYDPRHRHGTDRVERRPRRRDASRHPDGLRALRRSVSQRLVADRSGGARAVRRTDRQDHVYVGELSYFPASIRSASSSA
jgi:hypothetical protein